jgi:hypothetical protein
MPTPRASEDRTVGDRCSRSARASLGVLLTLAFLALFGLLVRVWGIGYMLPMAKLGDASFVLAQVDMLRSKDPPNYGDPAINRYPFLMSRAIALLPDRSRVGPDEELGLADHLRRASEPWIQARLVSVFFALLSIPGTWWLARRFLGDAWALLAAAFVATSLLHVDFSAQEPPHALVTTMILFTILASIRLRRRGDVLSYLLAAAFAGLSIGALQSGFSVVPAVVAAVVLRERGEGRAPPLWIVAVLAIVVLCFRWLYPFHFVGEAEDLSLVSETGERVLMLAGHKIWIDRFDGRGFANMLHTMVCFDPLLLVAAGAGAVLLAARIGRERAVLRTPLGKDMLVVLAHAAPYFLMCGIYARTFERFLLPLLPALACAGAYGVKEIAARLSSRFALGRPSMVAIGASLPLLAAVPALRLGQLRAAPDTQEIAAEWIARNVASDERIVVLPVIDLPLFPGESALAEGAKHPNRTEWRKYLSKLRPEQEVGPRFDVWIAPTSGDASPNDSHDGSHDGSHEVGFGLLQKDPMKYFAVHGARYVVLGENNEDPSDLMVRTREVLGRNARRVFRVSPERIDTGRTVVVVTRHPDPGREMPVFERPYLFWLFDSARMGRTIEIFRLE